MAALQQKLGIVEAEKFISIINREKIDYTRWRENLWPDKTLEEVYNDAVKFVEKSEGK
jgi:hypothetical protein